MSMMLTVRARNSNLFIDLNTQPRVMFKTIADAERLWVKDQNLIFNVESRVLGYYSQVRQHSVEPDYDISYFNYKTSAKELYLNELETLVNNIDRVC